MKAYMWGEKTVCRWTPASSNLFLSTVGHYHLKVDDNSSPKHSNTDSKAACLNLAVQKFVWEGETENPNPIFSLYFADFVVSKAHSSSLKDTPSFSALQLHLMQIDTRWVEDSGNDHYLLGPISSLCSCRALSSPQGLLATMHTWSFPGNTLINSKFEGEWKRSK